MKKIIIGARGSKLSLAYVSKVKNLLLQTHRDIDFEVKIIKTSGDIHQDIKISEIGGKNLFCKEIEENLLIKNIYIVVTLCICSFSCGSNVTTHVHSSYKNNEVLYSY